MKRDPSDYPGYSIVRLAHALEARMNAALKKEADLSVRQFGTLAQIEANPGIASAELARLILITPQSMGALVAGLERDGLLARDRSPGPGLRLGMVLTPLGHARLAQGYAAANRLREEEETWIGAERAARLNRDILDLLAGVEDRR